MRIDIDAPDAMQWEVYLDGAHVQNAVEADTTNGWVIVLTKKMFAGVIHWRGKFYCKKLIGRVELVHLESGKVVR